MIQVRRVRGLLAVVVAVAAMALSVGAASARVEVGAPEVAASPHSRTDASGDCVGEAGSGGANCDLLKVKIVNGVDDVTLVAVYRGAPYMRDRLPAAGTCSGPNQLSFHLEGDTDFVVTVDNCKVRATAVQYEEPDNGTFPCISFTIPSMNAVVTADRVKVTVPRSCLPGLTTLRAYATTEKERAADDAYVSDRLPNAGYTARIAQDA